MGFINKNIYFMVRNQNQQQYNESHSWDTFMFAVFYLWNIPQLCTKFIKPENMPAILSATPDQLIIFWRVILFCIFVFIVPWLITWLSNGKKVNQLKLWKIWAFPIGKLIYSILWFVGGLAFLFYFATEISCINHL